MRRAKIVATLGPATSSYERILALAEAGMDVARLNLSHGSYSDHSAVYERVRRASDESGRAIGILVDLQGPKIRLGRFASGPVLLTAGDTFTITTEDVPGDREMVSTTSPRATRSSSMTAAWHLRSPPSMAHGSSHASSRAAAYRTTRGSISPGSP